MVSLGRRVVALVPRDKARFATTVGIFLYAIESLSFVVLGQLNSDEGWYLYASKLVLQGALPYRDFSYTQTPLLPFVYGVWQVLQPSLLLGRVTSVVISLGVLLMGIAIARRYAGSRGGALAALLAAAFTFGVYFDSIVKTYALLGFFFSATLFLLSSDLEESAKHPLALLCAICAALVRLTSLLFAAPVFLYVLAASRPRTRVVILLEGLAASLLAGYFLFQVWETAEWDLLESHLSNWGDVGPYVQIHQVLGDRLADIVQNFGVLFLLFVAAAYFILRYRKEQTWRRNPLPLLIVMIGLALASAAHLVNGLWITEYLAPSIAAFLPILAIALSRVYGAQETQSRVFVQGTLIGLLLLLPLAESIRHIDVSGRSLPLAKIDQVADYVTQHTQPTDRVLALEALSVLVDANRADLPGMELAQFSFQTVDTPTAQRLHVVNSAMLVDAVNQSTAKVILLTSNDWATLQISDPAGAEALRNALNEHYAVAMTWAKFGQFDSTIDAYISR